MADEAQEKTLQQQLALLRAIADRPLTLPPIFVDICDGILPGLLLAYFFYWTKKNAEREGDDYDGWFFIRLPKLLKDIRMGKHELASARKELKNRKFVEEDVRGVPPTLWIRVDLLKVLEACNVQLSGNRTINYPVNGKSTSRKTEDQPSGERTIDSPESGESSSRKPDNHGPETGESYKEEETNLKGLKQVTKGEEVPLTRNRPPSPTVLLIAQRHFMEALKGDWREVERASNDPNPRRSVFIKVRTAAKEAGLDYTQAKRFLSDHPQWKDWEDLSHLDSQQEIEFPKAVQPAQSRTEPAWPDGMDRGATLMRAWEYIRDYTKSRISPHSFDTWLKPLRPAGLWQRKLYVQVPTNEFRHVGEKFNEVLQEAIRPWASDVVFLTPEQLLAYEFGSNNDQAKSA